MFGFGLILKLLKQSHRNLFSNQKTFVIDFTDWHDFKNIKFALCSLSFNKTLLILNVNSEKFQERLIIPNERIFLSDIDECASQPCENGGMCQDQINLYECICNAGYEGVNCEAGESCICILTRLYFFEPLYIVYWQMILYMSQICVNALTLFFTKMNP